MPYDTLLTCRHFKYGILYMATHVHCVYTPMHCALSCICLGHVLVCAGSVLTSMLQFFTVLVMYSWCLLIIPLFSAFLGAHCLVHSSFFRSVLPPLFSTSTLPFSPLPLSLLHPYHSAPYCLHLPPQGRPRVAVTGYCSCRTSGSQTSIPQHCEVCVCGGGEAISSPLKHAVL